MLIVSGMSGHLRILYSLLAKSVRILKDGLPRWPVRMTCLLLLPLSLLLRLPSLLIPALLTHLNPRYSLAPNSIRRSSYPAPKI